MLRISLSQRVLDNGDKLLIHGKQGQGVHLNEQVLEVIALFM